MAIKLLLTPEIVASTDLTARFFREAEASAAIESTHVVDVYDTGVDEESGLPFLIMAYLQGEDLERLVERVGPLNPVAAVRIGVQAATGLAKAHEVGIIHRDIKPANIFLATSEGDHVVKLLDFGIAKVTTERLSQSGAGPQALTSTGALLGTPLYMSPEQAQGLKNIDARTDVWSLGMCLYQSLAGKLPFGEVDTIGKLIVAIVSHEIPPLAELAPWVPKDLASVVQRTLERDLDKRIASARDLISELTPFLSGGQALPSSILVGVKESLDLTLAPGSLVAAPSVPGGSAGGPGSAPRLYATTAGISSDRRSGGAKPKRALGAVVALGVVATLVGGAVALKLASHPSEAGLAAVPAPPTPAFLRRPHQRTQHARFPQLPAGHFELPLRVPLARGFRKDRAQPRRIHRLLDKVVGAVLHGFHRGVDGALRREHHHGNLFAAFLQDGQGVAGHPCAAS